MILKNKKIRVVVQIPVTRSTVIGAPEVDLMFHNSPMDHIHKEDPREEAPAASLS